MKSNSFVKDFLSLFKSRLTLMNTPIKVCIRNGDYAVIMTIMSKHFNEIFNG